MTQPIKYYRQGEILIESLPNDTAKMFKAQTEHMKPKAENVIREGEVTGHLHKLTDNTTLYENEDGTMFFRVDDDKPAVLSHDEHDPISFPKGNYKVTIQREYDEQGYRYIAD